MKYCYLLGLLLLGSASFAQYRNVQVGGNYFPNEPSIAMDPKNPKHLVAGANFDNYYTSTDGGKTWQSGRLVSTYGVWGDPILMVDTAGSFYYFHMSDMSTTHIFGDPGWLDRMVCQRMDNFSGTWSGGTFTGLDSPKVQDKPGVAYDRLRDKFYLAWTQFDKYGSANPADSTIILFSSSSDKGQTWTTPVRLSTRAGDCIDEDNTVEGAIPCVGPNGEVYVSWASGHGIVFKKSTDGGQTWPAQETLVTTTPGGWDYPVLGLQRCNGLPFTACDISAGPHKGTIYINWSDKRNGAQNADVFISKSTDGGASWSAPVRVNDDSGRNAEQFMSSMAIDQKTGYVYVLFYDRRDATTGVETEVYLAVSKDGGATFQNQKISEQPFSPNSSRFLGDYTAVVADNGIVRPIWTRMDGFQTSIWTALVDAALHVEEPIAGINPLQQVFPNPFRTEAVVSFRLPQASTVSLSVADIYGRKVATILPQQSLAAGSYTELYHPNQHALAPGMYLFVLETEQGRWVQRAVYSQ